MCVNHNVVSGRFAEFFHTLASVSADRLPPTRPPHVSETRVFSHWLLVANTRPHLQLPSLLPSRAWPAHLIAGEGGCSCGGTGPSTSPLTSSALDVSVPDTSETDVSACLCVMYPAKTWVALLRVLRMVWQVCVAAAVGAAAAGLRAGAAGGRGGALARQLARHGLRAAAAPAQGALRARLAAAARRAVWPARHAAVSAERLPGCGMLVLRCARCCCRRKGSLSLRRVSVRGVAEA